MPAEEKPNVTAPAQCGVAKELPIVSQDVGMYLPPGQLSLSSERFELVLDVHNYMPEEIRVNVRDNLVEVCADHQKSLNQQVSQSIMKRYILPYQVNTELVVCNLSNDGILHLAAPWRHPYN